MENKKSILEILQKKPSISFEFFPPKSGKEDVEKLLKTIEKICQNYQASFVSVTYGAGGSTRELTKDLVFRILKETSITPIPHLTCVMHSEEEILSILKSYYNEGIRNVMALRGDIPKRETSHFSWESQTFRYAYELISFIQKFNQEKRKNEKFNIGIAGFPYGHPETPNRLEEMQHLKEKVHCGADYICTQLFFENYAFFDYRERCRLIGIDIPIIAGIMPISSLQNLKKISQLAQNVNFPAKLQKGLIQYQNCEKSLKKFAIDFTINQCNELIKEKVDGIHFYTLNKGEEVSQIIQQIDYLLKPS